VLVPNEVAMLQKMAWHAPLFNSYPVAHEQLALGVIVPSLQE
jgi:hypothetical protein